MLAAADALRCILDSAVPLGSERISGTQAMNRVLAADLIADEDVPPADVATMDGYAVRAAEAGRAPVTLPLTGEIPAGSPSVHPLSAGRAVRIMTGALLPEGCTAVVQKEWTERAPAGGGITILRPALAGQNIRRRGADIQKGSTVLRKGTRLRPQEIGVLASLGIGEVEVFKCPSVCVLATGDELLEAGAAPSEGKIRDSCSPLLVALALESGCRARSLGIARDTLADLRKNMAEGLLEDVLITSGGVSVGEYDLVGQAAAELGVEIKFWKVNIKPGMPLMFGTKGRCLFFGLPGNPVSAMVTFLEFVRPALRALAATSENPVRVHATLGHPIQKSDGKLHFMRGIAEAVGQDLVVRAVGPQDSGVLTSLTKANCLIIVPAEEEHLSAGQKVEIRLL